MKAWRQILFLSIAILSLIPFSATAQMCPGGGVDFNSVVTFDPSWIYGCNTGTSCNGGVNFDNRAGCQPTTALDACAPAPTCSAAGITASNIWFKFYASSSSVTLSSFQNSSFVIGIQAFSGGPTCGSLTQIGCAVAGGPSSGVNLTLTGLVVGQLYYYRIFGSANSASQRTGIYCFCGTTGADNSILPKGLKSFKGSPRNDQLSISWEIDEEAPFSRFVLQSSSTKNNFDDIAAIDRSSSMQAYNYYYKPGFAEEYYYRLKLIQTNGSTKYSQIIRLKAAAPAGEISWNSATRKLTVNSRNHSAVVIYNAQGKAIESIDVYPGLHNYSLPRYSPGIYFAHNYTSRYTEKFLIHAQ